MRTITLVLGMQLAAVAQESLTPTASPQLVRQPTVDFFGDGAAARRRPTTVEPPEALWAEPIRMPDGRMTVYVPPPAVLAFLSKPTVENARQYLAWQRERMTKLRDAMVLLEQVQREDEAKARPPATQAGAKAGAPAEIVYVKKPDCPWCARQDEAFEELKKVFPTLRIREVALESDEAKSLGADVAPSLVVPSHDGRRILIRGYTPSQNLRKILEGEKTHE